MYCSELLFFSLLGFGSGQKSSGSTTLDGSEPNLLMLVEEPRLMSVIGASLLLGLSPTAEIYTFLYSCVQTVVTKEGKLWSMCVCVCVCQHSIT